jgi:hypothetical protein
VKDECGIDFLIPETTAAVNWRQEEAKELSEHGALCVMFVETQVEMVSV